MTQRPHHSDPVSEQLLQEDPTTATLYEELMALDRIIVAIINARKMRGWSQRDLAEASGLKQPAVARLEKGNTMPRINTILRICRTLNLSITIGDAQVLEQAS